MSEDMEFSEACQQLAEIIQTQDDYIEAYALMIAAFVDACEAGETPRMALALAKQSVADIESAVNAENPYVAKE